ncbi:MAG: prolyl aminopeptidase [Halobacteriovoraceae bacterium]|nr:prolyl aminopeptidase [Halobacteriovoraceae bacterium]
MHLYPEIEPYHTDLLPVSDIHTLYVEQAGNPEGRPVVFLHGGPGGGCSTQYRRYFNPEKWRIILFDQRGCGRSTPFAELKENTTWDLVEDIERIREHLGIESWGVFGGSWGSTLALSYAVTHPEKVSAMFLRGIFMLRKKEIDWFYQEGASKIYPDAWEQYLAPIPEDERGNLVEAYYKRLTSNDAEERRAAAKAWSVWEASTSKLIQDNKMMSAFGTDDFSQAFARIECHYFINGGFFEEDNYLLNKVSRIRHIPSIIVQGRYDIVCPAESAWELHKSWPEAEFHMIANAGHSLSESGIAKVLIEATDRF